MSLAPPRRRPAASRAAAHRPPLLRLRRAARGASSSRCCGRRSPAASTSSSCARRSSPTTRSSARRRTFRRLCDTYSALFIVNDDPDLAARLRAPTASTSARTTCRPRRRASCSAPEAIVGLSTHSRGADRGRRRAPVDYISVGPVWETPTKEGRPRRSASSSSPQAARSAPRAVLRDRRHRPRRTSARSSRPGASGSRVVRAIRDADDPRAAAARLRAALRG